MAISVGVPDSILKQSAMAQNDYPNPSIPLDVPLYVLRQLTHTHRDPGGKPSGVRAYYPPLRLPQSTLDDLGHNQYGPMPTLRAMWLQLAPTQGCQELSHTECDVCVAAVTCPLQCHS